jgi:hypothetical protein
MVRRTLLSLFLSVALSGAALAEISFGGGDGTSPETAVVITGANGSSDGVPAEYDWITKHYPGAEVLGQGLMQKGDRFYDAITIRSGGKEQVIYFDITEFFGKF